MMCLSLLVWDSVHNLPSPFFSRVFQGPIVKQLLPKHTLDVKLFLVSSLRLPSRYDSKFILVRGGNASSASTTTPISSGIAIAPSPR